MTAPTIVLVHGAFVDTAVWAPVASELLSRGHAVVVPPLSNRSLSGDAGYLRSFVQQIDAPVILVGHSSGGAVIGIAGAAANVVGLVFVAAYVLEVGESMAQLQGGFPPSDPFPSLVYSPNPNPGGEPGTELSVVGDAFLTVLAAGVDPEAAAVLAVSQRPLVAAVSAEPASAAAWTTIPSWGLVATADRILNPDVQRYGYQRAGFNRVIELEAPHLVILTHPGNVADLIETAAHRPTE
jgi:pimeloyl-ACP methyl ester carboxylesterase